MSFFAKFGGPDLDSSVEFTFPNVWQREEREGRPRLLIGAREREIPLMLDLCRDLDRYESRLRSAGFQPGSVSIPDPHTHRYHAERDRAEDELMSHRAWKKKALRPEEDT